MAAFAILIWWQGGILSPREIPALLPPGRNSSFQYRMDAGRAIGQHTETILAELKEND